MANRYFCGAVDSHWNDAGNWDDTSSLGAGGDGVPTDADDVILDANSPASTLDANIPVKTLTMTSYANTLTVSANNAIVCHGNCALGGTWSGTGGGIVFHATGNFTSNGKNIGNLTINMTNSAHECFMLDGLTLGTTGIVTLTQGTLHTDGASDVSGLTHSWGKLSSTNSNTRTLNLGNSNITITAGGSGVIDLWNNTNFAFTCGNSIITLSGASAIINTNALTYYDIRFTGSGTSGILFNGANGITTNLLRDVGTSVKTDSFYVSGGNITVNGALTLTGDSSVNRLLVYSGTLGTARTITLGASATCKTNSSNVDFRDITMSGGAANERDLSAITGGSGDCGGNIGITFTTADDWYWYDDGAGTFNFSDYTQWYDAAPDVDSANGSQMASTRPPLPQDTCYFTEHSVNGSVIVDQDMPRVCKTLDFTGVDAMAFHMNNVSQTIYGSLTLTSDVALSNSVSLNFVFEGRDNYTCTMAGNSLTQYVYIQMVGGKLELQDDTTWNGRDLSLVVGTLDAATQDVNVTTIGISGNYAYTRNISMGTKTLTLAKNFSGTIWDTRAAGFTFTKGTSTVLFTAKAAVTLSFLSEAGIEFYDMTLTGGSTTQTFSMGHTFNTFTINAPKTVKFTAGTTTKMNKIVGGQGSGRINIESTSTNNTILHINRGYHQLKNVIFKKIKVVGGGIIAALNSVNVNSLGIRFLQGIPIDTPMWKLFESGGTIWTTAQSDAITVTATESFSFFKVLSDTLSVANSLSNLTYKVITDSLSVTDNIEKVFGKSESDSITVTETLFKYFIKVLSDSASVSDELTKSALKVLSDSVLTTETFYSSSLAYFIKTRYITALKGLKRHELEEMKRWIGKLTVQDINRMKLDFDGVSTDDITRMNKDNRSIGKDFE